MNIRAIIISVPTSVLDWTLINFPTLGIFAFLIWAAWKFNKSLDEKFVKSEKENSDLKYWIKYIWFYTTTKFAEHEWHFTRIYEEIGGLRKGQQRLEVAVEGLHGRIDALDQKFTGKFGELTSRIDGIDNRFKAVDHRFEAVERKFDAIDKRFEAVDKRFDAMDKRFDKLEEKIDSKFDAQTEINLRILSILEGNKHKLSFDR